MLNEIKNRLSGAATVVLIALISAMINPSLVFADVYVPAPALTTGVTTTSLPTTAITPVPQTNPVPPSIPAPAPSLQTPAAASGIQAGQATVLSAPDPQPASTSVSTVLGLIADKNILDTGSAANDLAGNWGASPDDPVLANILGPLGTPVVTPENLEVILSQYHWLVLSSANNAEAYREFILRIYPQAKMIIEDINDVTMRLYFRNYLYHITKSMQFTVINTIQQEMPGLSQTTSIASTQNTAQPVVSSAQQAVNISWWRSIIESMKAMMGSFVNAMRAIWNAVQWVWQGLMNVLRPMWQWAAPIVAGAAASVWNGAVAVATVAVPVVLAKVVVVAGALIIVGEIGAIIYYSYDAHQNEAAYNESMIEFFAQHPELLPQGVSAEEYLKKQKELYDEAVQASGGGFWSGYWQYFKNDYCFWCG